MTTVTLAPTLLDAIAYLRPLPRAEREQLVQRAVMRAFHRGAHIFDEGTTADGLWVVVEGRVRLVRTSPRGREQVLHIEGPGATLAEIPLFDGGGYVATAVAAEPARLLFLPRDAILDVCRRHPEVALAIVRVLAARLRTFAGLVEDLALKNLTARLAALLLAESRAAKATTFELTGTRDDIAAQLGTVRELVSRSLALLRRAGVVKAVGRRVTIVDPRGLRERADGP